MKYWPLSICGFHSVDLCNVLVIQLCFHLVIFLHVLACIVEALQVLYPFHLTTGNRWQKQKWKLRCCLRDFIYLHGPVLTFDPIFLWFILRLTKTVIQLHALWHLSSIHYVISGGASTLWCISTFSFFYLPGAVRWCSLQQTQWGRATVPCQFESGLCWLFFQDWV